MFGGLLDRCFSFESYILYSRAKIFWDSHRDAIRRMYLNFVKYLGPLRLATPNRAKPGTVRKRPSRFHGRLDALVRKVAISQNSCVYKCTHE